MKRVFTILSLSVLFFSCKSEKKSEPAQDVAQEETTIEEEWIYLFDGSS